MILLEESHASSGEQGRGSSPSHSRGLLNWYCLGFACWLIAGCEHSACRQMISTSLGSRFCRSLLLLLGLLLCVRDARFALAEIAWGLRQSIVLDWLRVVAIGGLDWQLTYLVISPSIHPVIANSAGTACTRLKESFVRSAASLDSAGSKWSANRVGVSWSFPSRTQVDFTTAHIATSL